MSSKSKLKNIIKILIASTLVASFTLVFLIFQKLGEKKEIISSYAQLPSLELREMDNSTIVLNEEYQDELVIIIIFSSECVYCIAQIEEILANISEFSNINIALITMEDKESILKFSQQYSISKISNIKLAFSENADTINWIAGFEVPSILIYNTEHKLVKFFEGMTNASEMLKYT